MMTLARAVVVSSLLALCSCAFTNEADTPPAAEALEQLQASVPDSCVPPSSGCSVSGLVPGSGRYFYPGSGNYHNDDGTACSTTSPCRYTGPRTPGGPDTDIVRFRDGVPKTSVTCGFGVVPTMTILALRPRMNGTDQTRLNANGQSTAPHAPFNDGTYEWYIGQLCIGGNGQHPGIVTTWYDVKTCSTVDDADPASNDNNISAYTTNPDRQLGACQSSSVATSDYVVHYSMSYNGTSMTPCWDTSSAPNPASFKTLTLARIGVRSSNLGLSTNIPTAPMVENGTLTTCTGATIDVTPWDGDACDGLEFHRWFGACSGTGACTVTMTSDTSVTALFTAHDCGPGKVWEPGACGCVARATAPAPVGPRR